MHDPVHEELISAYLDNELSAAERAQAEALLAEHPSLRQLWEELRSIQAELQAAPRRPLPADFSAKVLARTALVPPLGQLLRASEPAGHDADSAVDARRWLRPAVWAALTLAAGLLVMVLSPNWQQGLETQPLAHAPVGSAGHESMTAGARGAEAGPASPPAEREAGGHSPELGKFVDRATAARRQPSAMDKELDERGDRVELHSALGGKAPAGAAEEGAVAFDRSATRAAADPSLLVVQCDVSFRCVESNALAQTLASQQIDYSDTASPSPPLARSLRSRDDTRLGGADSAPATGREGAEQPLPAEGVADGSPAPQPLEIVYVEATPDQVRRTLEEIGSQPELFLNVTVVPAPNQPQQEPWQQYNRQNAPALSMYQSGAAVKAEADAVLPQAAQDVESAAARLRAENRHRVVAEMQAKQAASAGLAAPAPAAPQSNIAPARADTDVALQEQAAVDLKNAVEQEISQLPVEPKSAAPARNFSKAQRLLLPRGNAIEQSLDNFRQGNERLGQPGQLADDQRRANARAFNFAEQQRGVAGQNPLRSSGEKKTAPAFAKAKDDANAAPAASGHDSEPAADWQRAVFVLRVIDAGQGHASPPAADPGAPTAAPPKP